MEEKENSDFGKTKLGKFLKSVWEVFYYGIIYCIGVILIYDSSAMPEVPLWLLSMALLSMLIAHKGLIANYNTWELMTDDEFYCKFTKTYKPMLLFPQLILLFVFAKYCSIGTFIILYIVVFSYDVWDRRFITNNIKHDMILRELKKMNKYE